MRLITCFVITVLKNVAQLFRRLCFLVYMFFGVQVSWCTITVQYITFSAPPTSVLIVLDNEREGLIVTDG